MEQTISRTNALYTPGAIGNVTKRTGDNGQGLEPDEGKPSCPVLRGLEGGNTLRLPGDVRLSPHPAQHLRSISMATPCSVRFHFDRLHRCIPLCLILFHQHTLFRGQRARSLGTWFAVSLCTPSSRRLGAFAISPHPGVRGFPTCRLLCPIRLSPVASSFRETFALSLLPHCSSQPPRSLPCSSWKTQAE